MCGIVGFTKKDPELLCRMTRRLEHRGPDDEAYFESETLSFGMRRLAIIDLTPGIYPLKNEKDNLVLIFNGEIYNFQDLRKNLERSGHRFKTRCDAEVIVHGYEEWGREVVKKLNGIFALALWDKHNKELFLARDHLGVKPLYYVCFNGSFFFASEIKALLEIPGFKRQVDITALSLYLNFRFVPDPKSMFKGVYKLPPGYWMLVKGSEIKKISQYWDLDFTPDINLNEDEVISKIREAGKRSIRKQMVADVPVGAFLSGGIDSSIVVGLMSQEVSEPLKTFSVGFQDPKLDESNFANIVAKRFKTQHQEIYLDREGIKLFPHMVWQLDEPLADPAAIPTNLLARLARQEVTVVLTGEGGDEIFAGYKEDYPHPSFLLSLLIPEALREVFRNFLARTAEFKGKHLLYRGLLSNFERARHVLFDSFRFINKNDLLATNLTKVKSEENEFFLNFWQKTQGWDWLAKMLYLETKIWLPGDPLMKVDKMTMLNSLEARVPLLDYEIAELLAKVPSKIKIQNRVEKYLLRQAFEDILPSEVLVRRKHGFDMPLDQWLKEELKELVDYVFSQKEVDKTQYLSFQGVKKVKDLYYSGRRDLAFEIWTLLTFFVWHKIFIQEEKWENLIR